MAANSEMPKAYDPKSVEDAMYAAWERSGLFNPDNREHETRNMKHERKLKSLKVSDSRFQVSDTFSIVMPPPNVTGTLHVGHAVMLAIEDIMVRYHRMKGDRTLWIPGTDHAAIATQAKVEKELWDKQKKTRHDLGREKFLQEVERFAQESKDTIHRQIRKMGTSCDWSREAYTLDPERTLAVRTAFKRMYDDGLIYRGYRIVNWCPRCQSTLADDEVEYREQKTPFYYFKYGPVVIGTARPETKFVDKTIVVHPKDKRYVKLVGTSFDVEWIEGTVRANVIADPTIDMEFGTGAMTITPAHDFHDFELAQQHTLPVVTIIDEQGNLTDAAGAFAGKNARESRAAIVAILKKKGLVERVDDEYVHNLSICYRCGTPVEPLPKLQWFINVNKEFAFSQSKRAPIKGLKDGQKVTLKKLMQHVVKTKQIEIIPDRFVKTYFHWIDNLRDWNISRQIWFGHQVPVWYRKPPPTPPPASQREETKTFLPPSRGRGKIEMGDVETYVGVDSPKGTGWTQDPDTLDTWFSSGLWTFSTLGWPKPSDDLKTYHPTSVLETGYDILFFWIARMILMTTYLLGEVPFRTVYLHGLVRDEQGRKMSKSLGNIIDPLDVAEKYGTDAVRLSLVLGTSPGADSRLSDEKIAGFRNFANKLWNVSRFIISNLPLLKRGDRGELLESPGNSPQPSLFKGGGLTLSDRWILTRLALTVASVTKKIEHYNFSSAGEELRDFTWSELADWYLEIAKVQLADEKLQKSTQAILAYLLENVLKLWHPFMPFVTEAVWQEWWNNSPHPSLFKGGGRHSLLQRGSGRELFDFLMIKPWPDVSKIKPDAVAVRDFKIIQEAVVKIRNIRSVANIKPATKLHARVGDGPKRQFLLEHGDVIKHLARLVSFDAKLPGIRAGSSTHIILSGTDVEVFFSAAAAEVAAERHRLQKERDDLARYVRSLETKLANTEFVARAPERVVAAEREKLAQKTAELKKLEEQINPLP